MQSILAQRSNKILIFSKARTIYRTIIQDNLFNRFDASANKTLMFQKKTRSIYRIITKDKTYAINSTPQLQRKNPKSLESSEASTKSNMHKHRCTENERNLYKQTCTTYVSLSDATGSVSWPDEERVGR